MSAFDGYRQMILNKLFKRKAEAQHTTPTWYLWASTDVGIVRKANQDNQYLMQEICSCDQLQQYQTQKELELPILLAICDGMGGGADGEKASELAVKKVSEWDLAQFVNLSDEAFQQVMTDRIQQINDSIYGTLSHEGMLVGCTITILYVDEKRVYFINAGDSPGFVLEQGKLQAVTQSDNRANQMYIMGKISEKERWTHKTKNQLTQYLGMDPEEVLVSPHFYKMNVPDRPTTYLISSDGLIDGGNFEQIRDLLAQDGTHHIARELVEAAMNAGSRDNVTAIALRFGGTI